MFQKCADQLCVHLFRHAGTKTAKGRRIAPCASMLPRRGWTIARCKFVKRVPGPRKENFARSCYELRRCEIDVVLVWRLDRWGRSVTDLLTTLQDHLEVGFVSLTQALDLTTPAGRAMAGRLAVLWEKLGRPSGCAWICERSLPAAEAGYLRGPRDIQPVRRVRALSVANSAIARSAARRPRHPLPR